MRPASSSATSALTPWATPRPPNDRARRSPLRPLRASEALCWIVDHPARFRELTFDRFVEFWFPDAGIAARAAYAIWFATLLSVPGIVMMAIRREPVTRLLPRRLDALSGDVLRGRVVRPVSVSDPLDVAASGGYFVSRLAVGGKMRTAVSARPRGTRPP